MSSSLSQNKKFFSESCYSPQPLCIINTLKYDYVSATNDSFIWIFVPLLQLSNRTKCRDAVREPFSRRDLCKLKVTELLWHDLVSLKSSKLERFEGARQCWKERVEGSFHHFCRLFVEQLSAKQIVLVAFFRIPWYRASPVRPEVSLPLFALSCPLLSSPFYRTHFPCCWPTALTACLYCCWWLKFTFLSASHKVITTLL